MAKQQPNLIEPPQQTAYGEETQAQRRQREQIEQFPATNNLSQPLVQGPPMQPTGKKSPRPLDPTLRLAAKLDRLIGEIPEPFREWVLSWLITKHRKKIGD